MKKLVKINNKVKLAIIGDGDKRDIITNLIHDYHLENNIEMFGYQSNPYPYLKNTMKWEISADSYLTEPVGGMA